MDENLAESNETATKIREGKTSGVTHPAYGDAARERYHPRITQFVPQRPWTVLVLTLAALTVIVGLQAMYAQCFVRPEMARTVPFRCLHPQYAGSLAGWLSSLCLLAAAFQSVLIYRIRRHKIDDYRGRYRIWLVMPALLSVSAMFVATGIHVDLVALLAHALWSPSIGTASEQASATVIATTLLVFAIGVRMAFEIRASRLSMLFLFCTVAAYLAAAVMRLNVVRSETELLTGMATSSAMLLGHCCAALACTSYARYVLLDAKGLVEHKQKESGDSSKSKRRSQAEKRTAKVDTDIEKTSPKASSRGNSNSAGETPPATEKPVRTDERKRSDPPEKPVVTTPTIRKSNQADATSEEEEAPDVLDFEANQKLSKAERRRQRKLKRREQQRRAA